MQGFGLAKLICLYMPEVRSRGSQAEATLQQQEPIMSRAAEPGGWTAASSQAWPQDGQMAEQGSGCAPEEIAHGTPELFAGELCFR